MKQFVGPLWEELCENAYQILHVRAENYLSKVMCDTAQSREHAQVGVLPPSPENSVGTLGWDKIPIMSASDAAVKYYNDATQIASHAIV